ncbi:MAG: PEP-CTERM sorting domain-containing protein [Porticoccaceae bacterium]|nr:PEP-CTERM sorting domain-containing protein [Porticoccaceae bacterium]
MVVTTYFNSLGVLKFSYRYLGSNERGIKMRCKNLWIVRCFTTVALFLASLTALAVPINWTDWESSNGTNGFTALGSITTSSATVGVTYNNPQGVGFFQSSGGTDFWQNNRSGRNAATSPYTGAFVDNIPTGTDIVALRYAGLQSLSFSETIANPVFSYVSLNGNGYSFDQDFEILSFGDVTDGNDCGYWGCGTSYKNTVDLGGGVFEYQLLGTGEPHGSLRFTGAFDTVSWRSLSSENWNGFTVGIEGTAAEVFPPTNSTVPEPPMLILFGLALAAFGFFRKIRYS